MQKNHTKISFFSKNIWSYKKKAVLLHAFSPEEHYLPLPAEASFPDCGDTSGCYRLVA